MTGRVFRRSTLADPPVAVSAHGSTIVDAAGRSYLDAAGGAIVVNVGHGRREIATAMAEQAGRVAYAHGSAFTTEPLEAYAAEVGGLLPGRRPGDLPGVRRLGGDRDRAQAGPRLPPGPRRARTGTWSSRGGGATTATPSGRWTCPAGRRCAVRTSRGWAGAATSRRRIRIGPGFPDRTPSPTARSSRRSWTRRSGTRDPARVAAFVAEPIVGATLAAVAPPDDYWPAIAEVCRRHGVLLVADEVMTGFGRTGRWFGLDHWGVRADLVVAAKGATSGYWPFGFVAASGSVFETVTAPGAGFTHGFTFSHAAVGAAVAREVLRILVDEDLVAASAAKGDGLRSRLDERLAGHPAVGEIRGRGLFVGVELVADRSTRAPVPARGAAHRGGRRRRPRARGPALLRHGQRRRRRRRHAPARPAVRRHRDRAGPHRGRHRRGDRRRGRATTPRPPPAPDRPGSGPDALAGRGG